MARGRNRYQLGLRAKTVAKKLGVPVHPSFQVLRRSFSTHGKREAHPKRCRRSSATAIFGQH